MRANKIWAFALAGALAVIPSVSGLAQTVLEKEHLTDDATTPQSIAAEIQQSASAQQARGAAAARFGLYSISWAKDSAEYDALAHYAVLFVTVITQTQAELPLKRVYLKTPDGTQMPLRRLSSWRSGVKVGTLAYTMLGKFREDGFYLIPAAAARRPGEVQLDFAVNRVGFVLIHLPTTKEKFGYDLRETSPGVQPDKAALRGMIGRQYPGFPPPNL